MSVKKKKRVWFAPKNTNVKLPAPKTKKVPAQFQTPALKKAA